LTSHIEFAVNFWAIGILFKSFVNYLEVPSKIKPNEIQPPFLNIETSVSPQIQKKFGQKPRLLSFPIQTK
jgi:hypothetical protein